VDTALVQTLALPSRGPTGVTHQLLGHGARRPLPGSNAAANRARLVGLGDPGPRGAQGLLTGVAGPAGADAFWAAAAAGDGVFFQRFFRTRGGDGREIAVERLAPGQTRPWDGGAPGRHQAAGGVRGYLGAGAGQLGALGNDVETGEQGPAGIVDQVPDRALAFFAQQFESQQRAPDLCGGAPRRAGERGLLQDLGQTEVPHPGDEPEQAGPRGPAGAGGQAPGPPLSPGRGFRDHAWRAFGGAAARQACAAFFAEQHGQGLDADGGSGGPPLVLNVLHRHVPLAPGDGPRADAVPRGSRAWGGRSGWKERGAFLGVVTKRRTQVAEGTAAVTEALRDPLRRLALAEESVEGRVGALGGRLRSAEEVRGLGVGQGRGRTASQSTGKLATRRVAGKLKPAVGRIDGQRRDNTRKAGVLGNVSGRHDENGRVR